MVKSLKLALFLTVSLQTLAFATEITTSSTPYSLDDEVVENYKLKESLNEAISPKLEASQEEANASLNNENPSTIEKAVNNEVKEEKTSIAPEVVEDVPQIITETIEGGILEKLVTKEGLVIAEKKIINNEIVERVLNEYHPNHALARKIISKGEEDGSFYAEEYYPNGKKASEAIYINNFTKLGIEKRFDTNGVLRQEIPWVEVSPKSSKKNEERTSKREGYLNTYYPNGKIAASFVVGQKGKNVFYSPEGSVIREITNAELLDFSKQDLSANCEDVILELSLEELVELYEDEGDISYNKCGLPYRENFIYEINNIKGNKNVRISYDELGMIRRLTPYTDGYKNGLEQKFDAQGNLTAEISYKNGQKEGFANGFFPTREIAFRKRYEEGKVVGDLTCYFPTGEVAATIPYVDGKKEGVAKVSSPTPQEITFKQDKLVNAPSTKKRTLISKLGNFSQEDEKCLQLGEKIANLDLAIEEKRASIEDALTIIPPQGCEDFSKFKSERSRYVCYHEGKLKASYPPAYNKGHFATLTYFDDNAIKTHDIPYNRKQRQGVAKLYAPNNKVLKEISYNKDELSDTSRTFYDNAEIKDLYYISDDKQQRLYNSYTENSQLEFSLSYVKNQKNHAYLSQSDKNKDIYIDFYDDKIDVVKEINQKSPQNYIEYNLSLGEYGVYKDGEIIKAGKICGLDEVSQDINIITPTIPTTPIISQEDLPLIEDDISLSKAEEIELSSNNNTINNIENVSSQLDQTLVPTKEKEEELELKAQNIGPISKPNINTLTKVVDKETKDAKSPTVNDEETKTQKLYYPNGNIRKIVKTKQGRTEEIKEFSKTGLLLTDMVYNQDGILIEKYYGTGELRRKTRKSYHDNIITSFTSREDFYNTGKPRFNVSKQPGTLLFEDKEYFPNGELKKQTKQLSPLHFVITEYNVNQQKIKETEIYGITTLSKTYDQDNLIELTLNNEKISNNLISNSSSLLKDNSNIYGDGGALVADFKHIDDYDVISEYYEDKKLKSEIILYSNGEISIKSFLKDGTLDKFANLTPDGKLYLEKPERRVIPSYRERYWVDYNNPKWVENSDKYSIISIGVLNLDMVSYMLAELKMEVPTMIKKIYSLY
ncbi:MAG: hypothetical protein IKW58_00950 [Alphaproteobacteria bacterium]|nr:hypothetical protein [Alphaproteobacteria bacterium]